MSMQIILIFWLYLNLNNFIHSTNEINGAPHRLSSFESGVPKFEHGSYIFFIASDFKGVVGVVNATLDDNPSDDILLYEFKTNNLTLAESIVQRNNSGLIELNDYLNEGLYEGIMHATNIENGQEATAAITITVKQVDTIKTVKNTVLVKELLEEIEHPSIMETDIEDCEFEIVDQWPEGTDFFKIDRIRKVLHSSKFDREDIIFADTLIPQFKISLQLNCPNRRAIKKKASYIYSGDILYSTAMTYLTVIILDVNDNAPIFIEPSNDLSIGYPSPELAQKILPECLLKVRAIDYDEGFNAKIRYTIDENSHFTIDEKTGVILPLPRALYNHSSVSLKITATDRDGAISGLSTSIKLQVFKLLEKNLITMIYENHRTLTNKEILNELRNLSELYLETLKMVTIPLGINDSIASPLRTIRDTTLVYIVAYALSNGNLMLSDDIVKIFIKLKINVSKYEEDQKENCNFPSYESQEELYFILTITFASLLGFLLIGISILVVVVYNCVIKPLKNADNKDLNGIDNDLDQDLEIKPTKTVSAKYQKSSERRVSNVAKKRKATKLDVNPLDNYNLPVPVRQMIEEGDDNTSLSYSESGSSLATSTSSELYYKERRKKSVQFGLYMAEVTGNSD